VILDHFGDVGFVEVLARELADLVDRSLCVASNVDGSVTPSLAAIAYSPLLAFAVIAYHHRSELLYIRLGSLLGLRPRRASPPSCRLELLTS
jgi:hypothetical protein